MARHYSAETLGVLDGTVPPTRNLSQNYRSKLKRIRATITMAAQADGDDIVLGKLPVGAVFAFGIITATATMGATATVAIGTTGATGKYRTAAVFTAVETPTLFGKTTAMDDVPLAAEELLLATIAAAALPGAGKVIIDIFYTDTV